MAAAEADLRKMNDKRMDLGYRSGEAIHDLVWLRVGDFYRDTLRNDDKAYASYTNITDRTAWVPWSGRPRKPAARGADETLVLATKAACDILRKRGKEDEIATLQYNLVLAQAEAAAAVLNENETIARFKEILVMPGKSPAGSESFEKRINAFPDEARTNVVKEVGALASGLLDDTRGLLVKLACAPDPSNRSVALKSLLMFAPADKVKELLDKTEADFKAKSIKARLEPALKRLRELAQGNKWQALADEFKDTDFAAWEEKTMAAEALQLRGRAFAALKDGARAETDLKKSLELAPGDRMSLFALAENYQNNLQDKQKELESLLKIHKMGIDYGWLSMTIALRAARIINEGGKKNEALALLKQYDQKQMGGSWGDQFKNAIKDIEASPARPAQK